MWTRTAQLLGLCDALMSDLHVGVTLASWSPRGRLRPLRGARARFCVGLVHRRGGRRAHLRHACCVQGPACTLAVQGMQSWFRWPILTSRQRAAPPLHSRCSRVCGSVSVGRKLQMRQKSLARHRATKRVRVSQQDASLGCKQKPWERSLKTYANVKAAAASSDAPGANR